MRGTASHNRTLAHRIRFIPAHAGNRFMPAVSLVGSTVHPRACGEQFVTHFGIIATIGSSPRMRGTALIPLAVRADVRTVHPRACGEHIVARCAWTLRKIPGPVHPRACGEQAGVHFPVILQNRFIPAHAGNSRAGLPGRCGIRRFIPAHAGNRWSPSNVCKYSPVHPRACGEQR